MKYLYNVCTFSLHIRFVNALGLGNLNLDSMHIFVLMQVYGNFCTRMSSVIVNCLLNFTLAMKDCMKM